MYKDVEVVRDNVKITKKMPLKIEGEKRVERLIFPQKNGESAREILEIDGVFMLRDTLSPSVLVAGLEMEDGRILVQKDMRTNVKGLYAAGDCTGRPYQYAKAVGEGNIAAHSVSEYLK